MYLSCYDDILEENGVLYTRKYEEGDINKKHHVNYVHMYDYLYTLETASVHFMVEVITVANFVPFLSLTFSFFCTLWILTTKNCVYLYLVVR